MAINAKLIHEDLKTVTDVQLSDDPTESELTKVLGATEASPLKYLGQMGGWEIIHGSGSARYLMLGSAPYLSHHGGEQVRASCTLNNERVVAIVKFFLDGWQKLGFPKLSLSFERLLRAIQHRANIDVQAYDLSIKSLSKLLDLFQDSEILVKFFVHGIECRSDTSYFRNFFIILRMSSVLLYEVVTCLKEGVVCTLKPLLKRSRINLRKPCLKLSEFGNFAVNVFWLQFEHAAPDVVVC